MVWPGRKNIKKKNCLIMNYNKEEKRKRGEKKKERKIIKIENIET